MRTQSIFTTATLILAVAAGAAAQTGTLDQDNTANKNLTWNMAFFPDLQQEVRVGVAGQLEGFVIRMASQNVSVGLPVALFAGGGPHAPSTAPLWSGTAFAATPGSLQIVFVDVTSAPLFFNAGDLFTIRVGNGSTGVSGTDLSGNSGFPSPYYPENFYEAGASKVLDRLYFQSYVVACPGTSAPYGPGCIGSGGHVPKLEVTGCPKVGDQIAIEISNGLGGANALLLFGLGQGTIPIGFGCDLAVAPLFGPQIPLTLSGSQPGGGTLVLSGVLPPSVAGVTFTTQAFVLDPGAPIGIAATNAVIVTIV